jgi:hypothetical protein
MCITKFDPYGYKTHMFFPLNLIRDSSWGLHSPDRDVDDVSCRQVGVWETKFKLSCTTMEQNPFCEYNSFSVA